MITRVVRAGESPVPAAPNTGAPRVVPISGAAPPSPAASALMRRVASRPSMPGMRTSISTTSGCSRSASATACSPSPACPTTSMSGCDPITMAKPARTSS